MGDRESNLSVAIDKINSQIGKIYNISSIYESEPWGVENQENYLNFVLEVQTEFNPLALLAACQGIENEMGRRRILKWESRIIDIDILLFDDYNFSMHDLKIPHPLMQNRKFVLRPLAELVPKLLHPVLLKSIEVLNKTCLDNSEVKFYKQPNYENTGCP